MTDDPVPTGDPSRAEAFLAACVAGDTARMGELLDLDRGLAGVRTAEGATGLHLAVRHPAAVRLLLRHGADPGARDVGDNALPIHGAAGHGHLDSVRALLDAGSDVQGAGDLHEMDVIGWAACFAEPRRDVVELLLARGARHHVFSAIALGDREALRGVVAVDPGAIHRRLSKFEQHQGCLHYVVAPADGLVGGTFRTGDHHATLALLLELGADVAAVDARGRTPLEVAMLRGDREAMRLLRDAGAAAPEPSKPPDAGAVPHGAMVRGLSPMLAVRDVDATVAWYRAIGFQLAASHEADGRMDWASLTLGACEVMVTAVAPPWRPPASGASLWFRTDRLDDLYARLRGTAMQQARDILEGREPEGPPVRFVGDLYTAFYGQREFSLRDPDGIDVCFYEPLP